MNNLIFQIVGVLGFWGSVKKFITPLIIHELTVSPGCTLAEITTAFFLCNSSNEVFSVIVNISQSFPANVLHKTFLEQIALLLGSFSIVNKSVYKSV
jgi:hypothetical protein